MARKLGLISTSLMSVHGYATRTYKVFMAMELGHISTSLVSVHGYETRTYKVFMARKLGLISTSLVSVYGYETRTYKVMFMARKLGHHFRSASFMSVAMKKDLASTMRVFMDRKLGHISTSLVSVHCYVKGLSVNHVSVHGYETRTCI